MLRVVLSADDNNPDLTTRGADLSGDASDVIALLDARGFGTYRRDRPFTGACAYAPLHNLDYYESNNCMAVSLPRSLEVK
ncbi:MAG: hypothetical protein ACLQBJ_18185 [Bryobacteraceae bacterium]